ncbi:MAG: hypothetical protein HY724_06860, partial [Candidatus Rokubacteria bacterium]|nr:hypothetical protein [Candidatus Rokubacteria bacterium]
MDQLKAQEERIDFRRYLSFLWKGKWIILLACLGTASSAWVGSLLTTPIYEGLTNVQLDEDPATLKGSPSITRSLDTQVEIIKSRTTIEDAVRHINFHVAVEDAPPRARFTISPIVADAGIRAGVFKVVFEDPQGNYRLLNAADQVVGRGSPLVPFKGGGLSFT